tara:strand:- start:1450 stop:1683 length:234 start_codon:yes stop_codon:yes gene_type:complete
MALSQSIYRLIALDGRPHKVLDAPYESMDAAIRAAREWCNGQGLKSSLSERSIGVEVMTSNGSWRTVCYPSLSLQPV